MESHQGRPQITQRYPTRKHEQQAPTPRMKTQKTKPLRPPRVEPSEVTVEALEQRKTEIPPKMTPSEVPTETKKKRKHGRTPRVAPIKVTMLIQQ